MLKKKSSNTEKKRKHSQSDEKRDGSKRRSTEPKLEDELADPELDRIGSDIEEGGLDLNLPFQPITAYVSDKQEMLEQCFHALGEKKLWKMLPDELKQEQVLLGVLVNGVSMLGGEEKWLFFFTSIYTSFRTGFSSSSGPAHPPEASRSYLYVSSGCLRGPPSQTC